MAGVGWLADCIHRLAWRQILPQRLATGLYGLDSAVGYSTAHTNTYSPTWTYMLIIITEWTNLTEGTITFVAVVQSHSYLFKKCESPCSLGFPVLVFLVIEHLLRVCMVLNILNIQVKYLTDSLSLSLSLYVSRPVAGRPRRLHQSREAAVTRKSVPWAPWVRHQTTQVAPTTALSPAAPAPPSPLAPPPPPPLHPHGSVSL